MTCGASYVLYPLPSNLTLQPLAEISTADDAPVLAPPAQLIEKVTVTIEDIRSAYREYGSTLNYLPRLQ